MKVSDQSGRESIEKLDALREDTLLKRVRAGGTGWQYACSALLERHRGTLYRRCLQRLGNIQDAEDALQETMLRALLGIRAFEGRSGLCTWLFTIADNELADPAPVTSSTLGAFALPHPDPRGASAQPLDTRSGQGAPGAGDPEAAPARGAGSAWVALLRRGLAR